MLCCDYNVAYTRRWILRPCLTDVELRELEALEKLCFPPQDRYDLRTLRVFVSLNGIGVLRYYNDTLDPPMLAAFHLFDCLAGELITLDVHPDYRGRGVATLLLATSLAKLRSLGHTSATCEIEIRNEVSLRLHAKFGFRPLRILKNYYGPGRDAYLMRTHLRALAPRPSSRLPACSHASSVPQCPNSTRQDFP